jgi:hypothetical protein
MSILIYTGKKWGKEEKEIEQDFHNKIRKAKIFVCNANKNCKQNLSVIYRLVLHLKGVSDIKWHTW